MVRKDSSILKKNEEIKRNVYFKIQPSNPAAFAFVIMAFYLAFISQDFNRVKLFYPLSSYSSRAPPQVS